MNYRGIKNLKKKIEYCLKNYEETRNSDITLMIKIIEEYYSHYICNGMIELEKLYELPREDNIKRIRARFNSNGKYLPTSEAVAKKRGIDEDTWRLAMGYPTTGKTLF